MLADSAIAALLYADDIAILSVSQTGVKKALALSCLKNNDKKMTSGFIFCTINYKMHKWPINRASIEQVCAYKYPGVQFKASLSWSTHFSFWVRIVQWSSSVVLRFFH